MDGVVTLILIPVKWHFKRINYCFIYVDYLLICKASNVIYIMYVYYVIDVHCLDNVKKSFAAIQRVITVQYCIIKPCFVIVCNVSIKLFLRLIVCYNIIFVFIYS